MIPSLPPINPEPRMPMCICLTACRDHTFFALRCRLHMPVEESEDFFRISSEVVVAVSEAVRRILNPDHLLLRGPKHVEGLLRVFRVRGPGIVYHLNRQVSHRDF